ncbi:MAG: DapH/DapD/GlmU-related protein, partial [Myxococcota bacterium]|nr:DapH/DapD/GlmU-related protein [Myxococcota bacterium]
RRDEFSTTSGAHGVSMGANATLVCGVRLGHDCMIGAGSVVTRDVLPFSLVVGNPARPLGWVCRCGERLEINDALAACERCERRYRLHQGTLSLLEDSR